MKFATDKVTYGYLPTYLRIAAELGPAARVCEVGVDRGHGLDMLQALFPDGLAAGVDANDDCRWPEGTIQIVCLQDGPLLPARLRQHSPEWDLFIDDASHDGNLTVATMRLLWPLLAPGGFYVVEDWMVGLDSWAGYDGSMLTAAQGLLTLLTRDGDVEDITYRYGLAVLRKRGLRPPGDRRLLAFGRVHVSDLHRQHDRHVLMPAERGDAHVPRLADAAAVLAEHGRRLVADRRRRPPPVRDDLKLAVPQPQPRDLVRAARDRDGSWCHATDDNREVI